MPGGIPFKHKREVILTVKVVLMSNSPLDDYEPDDMIVGVEPGMRGVHVRVAEVNGQSRRSAADQEEDGVA